MKDVYFHKFMTRLFLLISFCLWTSVFHFKIFCLFINPQPISYNITVGKESVFCIPCAVCDIGHVTKSIKGNRAQLKLEKHYCHLCYTLCKIRRFTFVQFMISHSSLQTTGCTCNPLS